MIRCGLISRYLEIKSPSLLIYRSHFKRFVSLTHTCTLSHGQILIHTNQCKTIALKLLSCLFTCHFLLGSACYHKYAVFWWGCWHHIPSLLLFFTTCLSKDAANPIASVPLSPPTNKSWELRTSPHPQPRLWSSQDDPGVITINVVAVLPSPTSLLNRTLCTTFPFFARLRTAHHHLREICLQ